MQLPPPPPPCPPKDHFAPAPQGNRPNPRTDRGIEDHEFKSALSAMGSLDLEDQEENHRPGPKRNFPGLPNHSPRAGSPLATGNLGTRPLATGYPGVSPYDYDIPAEEGFGTEFLPEEMHRGRPGYLPGAVGPSVPSAAPPFPGSGRPSPLAPSPGLPYSPKAQGGGFRERSPPMQASPYRGQGVWESEEVAPPPSIGIGKPVQNPVAPFHAPPAVSSLPPTPLPGSPLPGSPLPGSPLPASPFHPGYNSHGYGLGYNHGVEGRKPFGRTGSPMDPTSKPYLPSPHQNHSGPELSRRASYAGPFHKPTVFQAPGLRNAFPSTYALFICAHAH